MMIVLEQSHDSVTWITFFYVLSNVTSKQRKKARFLEFQRKTWKRILKLWRMGPARGNLDAALVVLMRCF